MGDGEDLVSRANAASPQSKVERFRAAANTDRVRQPHCLGKFLLESSDFRPENVPAAFKDPANRGVERFFVGLVIGFGIGEWQQWSSRHGSPPSPMGGAARILCRSRGGLQIVRQMFAIKVQSTS